LNIGQIFDSHLCLRVFGTTVTTKPMICVPDFGGLKHRSYYLF